MLLTQAAFVVGVLVGWLVFKRPEWVAEVMSLTTAKIRDLIGKAR